MKDRIGRIEQMIMENFGGRECMRITLTYRPDEEPTTMAEAERLMRGYREKIRKRYQRRGLPFCAVSVTGLHGRIHHHLICSLGMEPKELQEAWDKGLVWAKPVSVDVMTATEMALHLAANH